MSDKSFEHKLQVGDLIRCYHKGVWRVTKIEHRYVTKDDLKCGAYEGSKYEGSKQGDECYSLLYYERVANGDLKPASKMKKCCDEFYCGKIDKLFLQERIDDLESKIKMVQDFAKEHEIK
jgi:hypothetical protein